MPSEWEPISEAKIWDKINDAWPQLDFEQRRLWEMVRIMPQKWRHEASDIISGYHDRGSWVVAMIGQMILWYDDIEEGFRLSPWTRYGFIGGEYWTGETSLGQQLETISNYFNPLFSGPPSGQLP